MDSRLAAKSNTSSSLTHCKSFLDFSWPFYCQELQSSSLKLSFIFDSCEIWIYPSNFVNVCMCHCPWANYPGNIMLCSHFLYVATFYSWEMIEAWKTQGTPRPRKLMKFIVFTRPFPNLIFKLLLGIGDSLWWRWLQFRADCNLIQLLWVFTHSGVDHSVPQLSLSYPHYHNSNKLIGSPI